MSVNLSKFHGIPTKKSDAIRQFDKILKEESGYPFSRGRYLVLRKLKTGMYKGCYSTFIYETKPKKSGLKIRRIPR